jgi:hypothetical protein
MTEEYLMCLLKALVSCRLVDRSLKYGGVVITRQVG